LLVVTLGLGQTRDGGCTRQPLGRRLLRAHALHAEVHGHTIDRAARHAIIREPHATAGARITRGDLARLARRGARVRGVNAAEIHRAGVVGAGVVVVTAPRHAQALPAVAAPLLETHARGIARSVVDTMHSAEGLQSGGRTPTPCNGTNAIRSPTCNCSAPSATSAPARKVTVMVVSPPPGTSALAGLPKGLAVVSVTDTGARVSAVRVRVAVFTEPSSARPKSIDVGLTRRPS
jgi:hypothetical protein